MTNASYYHGASIASISAYIFTLRKQPSESRASTDSLYLRELHHALDDHANLLAMYYALQYLINREPDNQYVRFMQVLGNYLYHMGHSDKIADFDLRELTPLLTAYALRIHCA